MVLVAKLKVMVIDISMLPPICGLPHLISKVTTLPFSWMSSLLHLARLFGRCLHLGARLLDDVLGFLRLAAFGSDLGRLLLAVDLAGFGVLPEPRLNVVRRTRGQCHKQAGKSNQSESRIAKVPHDFPHDLTS
jgi:hypothetical protein